VPSETGAALLAVGRAAFAQALQLNAIIAAVVMAGLAITTAVMLRDVRLGGEIDTQPNSSLGDELAKSSQCAYRD
jgi:hypothetical protein